MEKRKFKNWWFLALNGLIFTLFGILILFFTQEFIKTMLIYFGIVMLILGGITLLAGINNIRRDKAGAVLLLEAIIGIAIGLALIIFPEASTKLFLVMVGIWAVIVGIIQLVIIINLKESLNRKNLHMINGLLTIGLGVVLLFNPFQWAIFLIKLVGVCAVLFGGLLVWFALAVRRRDG